MDDVDYTNKYDTLMRLYNACYTNDAHTVVDIINNNDISKEHLCEAAEHACARGNIGLLKILIGCGADNYQELMITAASNGYLPIIEWMHEIGGDSTSYNNYYVMDRCLSHACKNGYLDIIKFLMSKHPDINYNMHLNDAALERRMPIMRIMLDHGANNHDYIDENTTELLLTEGYDINNKWSDKCKKYLSDAKKELVKGYINDLYLPLYDINITNIICDYVNHY